MTVPAVELIGASIGHEHRPLVGDLDLRVEAGGLLVVMGTNGSGKSTLLKTLAGLLAPVAGTVRVLGADAGRSPARVAYLPQHPPRTFALPLRAGDVVAMGRFARLGLLRRPAAADRLAVERAMARTGVTPFARQPLRQLSGGQQQRAHLAQVLARDADLLLLDEPTAGLDAGGRAAVADVVAEERARGAAVVLATHDLDDAVHADEVLLVARRVVALGPPGEALSDEHLRECYGFTDRH